MFPVLIKQTVQWGKWVQLNKNKNKVGSVINTARFTSTQLVQSHRAICSEGTKLLKFKALPWLSGSI